MATDAVSNDPIQVIPAELGPVVDHLVTEDDTPVDNFFSEKQQRLLTEALYSSWTGPGPQRSYVAAANVGLFFAARRPPLVPDMLLSLDVELPADLQPKSHRSYFVWEYGKPPDVVVEVVSNREGGEDTEKLLAYARVGIRYYVVFDPERLLGPEVLRVYRLEGLEFHRMGEPIWFPDVGLGLSIWQGRYEDYDSAWLRWVDAEGTLVPTGYERAEAERQRAEAERQRADRLAEQLRQLGVEPPKP
jgi:Uma2 family endonuclease